MPATITFVKNRVPVTMNITNQDGQGVLIEGTVASSSVDALVKVSFQVTGHMAGGAMVYKRSMQVPELSYEGSAISASARCQTTASEVTFELVQRLDSTFNAEDDALPRVLHRLLKSPQEWLAISALAAAPTAYGNYLMTVLADHELRSRLENALKRLKQGQRSEEADAFLEVLRATQGPDPELRDPLDKAFEAIGVFEELPA